MSKARVLIVDDAPFMRVMLKQILSKADFEVVGEAENGIEAFKQYKELSPDIVTMDITMDKKNGIEALKDIQKFDSDSKIVMCSALGQQSKVVEAIKAGAKDFIVKPFQAERVLEAVNRAIGK